MPWDLRPVAGEDFGAVGVEFDLADGGHAGAFEAEFEAAYACEQGEDVHAAARRVAAQTWQGRSARSRAPQTPQTSSAGRWRGGL
jgi:hypothetical protein